MGKRVIKCTPVAVLLALLALFLSTGIAAADPPLTPLPLGESCVLVTSTGVKTAYTVKAVPINNLFPIPMSGGGWMWRYQFSAGLTGTGSQFGALVPVCADVDDSVNGVNYTGNYYFPMACDTSGTCVRAPSGNMKIFPTASGYLSSNWGGWGIWDGNDNVVETTQIGSTFVAIGTDNDAPIPLRRTSMQFKKGNDLLFCANIAGPGCYARKPPPPPPAFAQYTVNEFRVITTSDGMQFCLATDPVTECEKAVYCLNDPAIPSGKFAGDELPYTDMTNIGIRLSTVDSTLQDIAIPGLRCPIVVLRDADPLHTIGVCNPVTKRCY